MSKVNIVSIEWNVSNIKEKFACYTIKGVNRDRLDQIIKTFKKRTTGTRKVLQDNGQSIDSYVTRCRKSPETRKRTEEIKGISLVSLK